MTRSPHVAFLFTHGFAARMVLRTGVAKRLVKQDIRVTVISPNAHEPYFQKECEEEHVELVQEPHGGEGIALWFRAYRPYFLDNVLQNPALMAGHLRRRKHYPIRGWCFELINRTLAKAEWFRSVCRKFESIVNRSPAVSRLLDQLRPDLLVLPNPFGVQEALYLLHAKELGIPVACQMLSWDNITCKGTPLMMPNYFISWGPVMTQEMVELYAFPRERIFECGVPHFDAYVNRNGIAKRKEMLERFGLPSDQPYILYGMGPRCASPNELDIVSRLAEQVNKSSFARPCSLVIRPHPQTISGPYALTVSELRQLHDLVSPSVALDLPPVLSEQLAWDLPKSDIDHLASLMAGTAMCLNASSTLCLDACMADRPVITVAFDGENDLPYCESARQGLDYIHIAKLLRFEGVRVARNYQQLKDHINRYLENPSLEQDRRLLTVTQECGPKDGRATERVAAVLIKLSQRESD